MGGSLLAERRPGMPCRSSQVPPHLFEVPGVRRGHAHLGERDSIFATLVLQTAPQKMTLSPLE